MQTEVGRWGNSLALRIPAKIAQELGLVVGSEARLELSDGALVITPKSNTPRLKELLASLKRVGPEREISSGPEQGNEVVKW